MKTKQDSAKRIPDLLGWYGVIAILAAYALLTASIVAPHSFWYQLLNLTGAMGLVVDGLSHKDYQPAVLNLVWMIIALAAIVKLLLF